MMIFHKTGRHIRENFCFGQDRLMSTRQYKYLGFLVTPSGEISSGLKDLKDRALRAFYKLKTKMGSTFRTQPSLTVKLFRSLIEPILLYASDLWGVMKLPTNNPIENLFISFCKQLLGVQKQTTNNGVLLELGLIPITILGKKKAIKNTAFRKWWPIQYPQLTFFEIQHQNEAMTAVNNRNFTRTRL